MATTNLQRTDEDILAIAPIKIRLGAETYDVSPLRILAARSWRAKLVAEVKSISDVMKQDSATPQFVNGLAFMFLQFPEKIADLVFAYAKDLPRERVEEEATEEQLAKAFGMIVEVAFPFAQELQTMSRVVGIAASFPR